MKIIAIGDVHGSSEWKNVKPENYDKVVFMGDYVDDFDRTDEEIIQNLKDIIELKKNNVDKVVLLLGNHDIQYILWNTPLFDSVRCIGFRNSYLFHLYHLFETYKDYFQVVYQIQNYLFTHAGISNEAWNLYFLEKASSKEFVGGMENSPIVYFLNKLWELKDSSLFHIGVLRGGLSDYGSIFWADMGETVRYPLNGYHQVVGHTPVKVVTKWEIDSKTSITYIDAHYGNKEFYELEIKDEISKSEI